MPPLLHSSVSEQVLASLTQDPNSVAVIDGVSGHKTTRAQLAEQIQRAAGWMKQNINAGSHINIAIPYDFLLQYVVVKQLVSPS